MNILGQHKHQFVHHSGIDQIADGQRNRPRCRSDRHDRIHARNVPGNALDDIRIEGRRRKIYHLAALIRGHHVQQILFAHIPCCDQQGTDRLTTPNVLFSQFVGLLFVNDAIAGHQVQERIISSDGGCSEFFRHNDYPLPLTWSSVLSF